MNLKVNILGYTLKKQGEKYNTYDISYEKDGKGYSASYFGKEPLPSGEGEYDIVKENDRVIIRKIRKENKGGARWEPKTEAQLKIEERVKYPSFAVAYAKDLLVAGTIKKEEFNEWAATLHKEMLFLASEPERTPTIEEKIEPLKEEELPF